MWRRRSAVGSRCFLPKIYLLCFLKLILENFPLENFPRKFSWIKNSQNQLRARGDFPPGQQKAAIAFAAPGPKGALQRPKGPTPGVGGLPWGPRGFLALRVPGGSIPNPTHRAPKPRPLGRRRVDQRAPQPWSPRRGLLCWGGRNTPSGVYPPRTGGGWSPGRSGGAFDDVGCASPPPWGGLGPWLPARVATTQSALRGRVPYARSTLRP